MAKSTSTETPIINILTFGLPYDLANQMYNEYQNRMLEAKYLLENYSYYKVSVRPTTYCQEAFYLSQIVSFQQFGQGFL